MTTPFPSPLTAGGFAVVASDRHDTVVAATTAGLVRSDDGGRSWRPADRAALGPVECVAPSPLYLEDEMLLVGSETGVVRSLDGGENWASVLTGSPAVALIAALDRTGDRIVLAGTASDGIFRSVDGGAGWASANPGLFELEILALAASPDFASDRTFFAGTTGGLYRSRNGGLAWRPLELPMAESAVQALALSPSFAADGVVLAGTEADGLLHSADGGTSWCVVPALGGYGVAAIAWSWRAAGHVVAATATGIARSVDGGLSWRIVADPGPVLALTFALGPEGEALLAGLPDAGILRSIDGGQSWGPVTLDAASAR